jgi:hypothetical protein
LAFRSYLQAPEQAVLVLFLGWRSPVVIKKNVPTEAQVFPRKFRLLFHGIRKGEKNMSKLAIVVTMCCAVFPLQAQTKCFPDPSDPQQYMFCEKFSPPYVSGQGKLFSPFYSITSDPAPSGYELVTAAFWLEGPHPCSGTESSSPRMAGIGKGRPGGLGNWADCYEEKRDKSTVTWKFSIQGTEGQWVPLINEKGIGSEQSLEKIQERAKLITRYVKK